MGLTLKSATFVLTVLLVGSAAHAQIFVVSSPLAHQVLQRDPHDRARVTVAGNYTTAANRIEARAVPHAGFSGTETDWKVIADNYAGGDFSGTLTLSVGWYDVEVRAMNGTSVVTTRTVGEFGVGDVYVTAGQSNAANNGSVKLTPSDPRVSASNMVTWTFAADPQPYAQGANGSPWPAFGDGVVDLYDIPVGMVSVGYTSTTVAHWLPGGQYYPRLQAAVEFLGPFGFKAILWHQGESDAYGPTTAALYQQRLEQIIAASRADAGFHVPWGVAIASYGPGLAQSRIDTIASAQQATIAADRYAFLGANTNELIDGYRAPDGIHMNEPGLMEHGARWAAAVDAYAFYHGPVLDYTSTDLGDGLIGYTFYIDNDDELSAPYSLQIGFEAMDGATLHQIAYNGAMQINSETMAELADGGGSPPYDKDRDSWAFSPFGDNPVPGTNPLTGTPLSGFAQSETTYAISCYSGAGAQLGDGVNVAYIVSDGEVRWTGSIEREGQTFNTLGFAIHMATLAGDYNGDGTVSGADYVVWANNFGATAP